MNGFATHGIDHVSPSSLSLFQVQPALWVMQKLLKRGGAVGCAAHRGTAAEAGIAAGLCDPKIDPEECVRLAIERYDQLATLSSDPGKEKQRNAIPGIVSRGLLELRAYGAPHCQGKVEHIFDDIPVPVVGYYDFFWEEHGIILDLKTSLKLDSQIKPGHARQVALYIHNTNYEGRVAYVTPARLGVYRLEDASSRIEELRNIARRLNRFLSMSNDAQVLASILCPDTDSFYYSDAVTRAHTREVYGL